MTKKLITWLLIVCMVLGMFPVISVAAEEEAEEASELFMEFSSDTDSARYLTTVGSNAFNVFMYNNTFSGTFGDQHMGGIELSLNGTRIATNGDLHMLPTPNSGTPPLLPARALHSSTMKSSPSPSP